MLRNTFCFLVSEIIGFLKICWNYLDKKRIFDENRPKIQREFKIDEFWFYKWMKMFESSEHPGV